MRSEEEVREYWEDLKEQRDRWKARRMVATDRTLADLMIFNTNSFIHAMEWVLEIEEGT